MPKKDDLTNIAVYWNDEYIGEARDFSFVKGSKKGMAILAITGKIQIVSAQKKNVEVRT